MAFGRLESPTATTPTERMLFRWKNGSRRSLKFWRPPDWRATAPQEKRLLWSEHRVPVYPQNRSQTHQNRVDNDQSSKESGMKCRVFGLRPENWVNPKSETCE